MLSRLMVDRASIDTLLRVRDRHMKKLLDLRNASGESVNARIRSEEDAIATIRGVRLRKGKAR